MNHVVIGLGSNIEPRKNTAEALRRIGARHRLVAQSKFVETEPIGVTDQPKFLNGVALIETELETEALEEWLRELEKAMGRVRTAQKYGPRTIDLDILVWNGEVVHRDYWTRDFVRAGVEEVLPGLRATK